MEDLFIGGIPPCGDCNALDPEWAALNRGLLLCNDCCFVHRSLGPQYSRVKPLADQNWWPKLWNMIMILASGSANHVWEHLLLDRSKADSKDPIVKKPFPYDSLESKRKFILAKHFQFQFVPRTTPEQVEVRSQELHSTVRTGAIDTTLRLLAGGADPNYFHPEKGTRPIHVAARNGQALQVELLHLLGANTAAPDYLGQGPAEHAMAAGHKELAQRILQLRYSLTDQLTSFVCGDSPDHSSSKHILVPSIKSKNPKHESDIRNLASYLLEQIAADLYDEVDRRNVEKVIVAKFGSESQKFSIAFLPVNPHYSSVRNQARQKFARLTDEELCTMISMVLSESEKRHCSGSFPGQGTEADGGTEKNIFLRSSTIAANNNNNNGGQSQKPGQIQKVTTLLAAEDDDFPLYDSVASDEDLVLAEQQVFLAQQKSKIDESFVNSASTNVHPLSPMSPVTNCELNAYKDNLLLSKLMETEAKTLELQELNTNLKQEIIILQQMVRYCIHENLVMKGAADISSRTESKLNNNNNSHNEGDNFLSSKHSRPSSMCDLLPVRESSLQSPSKEHYIRTGKLFGVTPIVHEATQRTVELIKRLIEEAVSSDLQGLKATSRNIYDVVHDMAQALVVIKEVKNRTDVTASLEKVFYQVLRLRYEIPSLVSSSSTTSLVPGRSSQPKDLVTKVKQLCFDVGAAMKEFMSLAATPPD